MKNFLFIISLLFFSVSAKAALLDVSSMSISGGDVSLSTLTDTYQLLPGDIGPMIMGTYQGSSACCSPAAAETSLAYFELGSTGWVGIHTSEFDVLSDQAAPPSGFVDTVNNTIQLDLSAWTMSYSGNDIHTGSNNIVGSYDAITGGYDISWSSMISTGIFTGQVFDWHVTGYATTVPVPAAIWLFGSGLLMFAGAFRRRQ